MKNISTCVLIILNFALLSQSKAQNNALTLNDAIQSAQKKSYAFKVAKNRMRASSWQYQNYKASFLPSLYLDGSIPNYSRAITKITVPSGEDIFVSQNQAYSSLNLGLRQNLGLTGGTISANTSLDRIDVFGENRQITYASTPFSIQYYQDNISYNPFKWQKKIEPIRLATAERQFVTDMESIAGTTVQYYFNVLAAQSRLALSRQNLANADTLYRISRDRIKLGTVDNNEILQLRLNILDFRKQVTQDSIDFVLEHQQFSRYLLLEDEFVLQESFDVDFFEIKFEDALQCARENSHNVIQFRLDRLEAEQNVEETKASTGLKFNVRANFGVTNTASRINRLLTGLENQQQVVVGFSLPILDWGYARTQRQQAESNLAMVEGQIEQEQLALEQEITLQTASWGLQQQQMQIAEESQHVAVQNFELQKNRFLRGDATINDLNIAQSQKDLAANNYIGAIRDYWILYYTIRKLTLYDFKEGKKLIYREQQTYPVVN